MRTAQATDRRPFAAGKVLRTTDLQICRFAARKSVEHNLLSGSFEKMEREQSLGNQVFHKIPRSFCWLKLRITSLYRTGELERHRLVVKV